MFQYIRRETQSSPKWMIFYLLLGIGAGVWAFAETPGTILKAIAFILAAPFSFIGACIGGYARRFSMPSRVYGHDMWDMLVKKVGLYITPPIFGCALGAFIVVELLKKI